MKISRTLVAVACAAALVSGTTSADAERSAAPVEKRVIKPGQVGKALTGMTVAQAMATGQFNKDVPAPPCDPIRLQPKGPWKNQYFVTVNANNRISEINVFGSRPRTVHGLGVGSTNAEIKEVYRGRLTAPEEVGFGQWGRYVKKGAGPDRRWIGFLFGDAFVDDGALKPQDTVTFVGVRSRFKPGLIADGC